MPLLFFSTPWAEGKAGADGKLVYEAFPNQFSTYQPPEFFPMRRDRIEKRVLIVDTVADPIVPARDYPTEAHDVRAGLKDTRAGILGGRPPSIWMCSF